MKHGGTTLSLDPAIRRHPDSVESAEFLRWAKADLKGGGRRERGNALGNIKKALHAKIDDIIYFTHVRFAKDWDPKCGTVTKIKVLKILGIEHQVVVNLVTESRNNFEHKYRVPPQGQIEAYLSIAEMWLERVSERHSFLPVGITGLHVSSLTIASGIVSNIEFERPANVLYFWDPKKSLVKIGANGSAEFMKFNQYTWENLLRIESKFIKNSFGNFTGVRRSELTKVYNRYRVWLKP